MPRANATGVIDDMRRQHSITQILGLEDRVQLINCPLPHHIHHNNTPSFSIYYGERGFQRFICHGNCDARGDVVDFVGYMNVSGYNSHSPDMVSQAIQTLDGRKPTIIIPRPAGYTKIPTLHPAKWKEYFPPRIPVLDYAASRGLTPETLTHFRIGQKALSMAMPSFMDGILVNIKYRRITNYGMRYVEEKGSVKSLFNYDAVAWTQEPVLITKGHIPTMLMHQNGILACNITAGENAHLRDFAPQLSFSKRRVYIGDNDWDWQTRLKMQAFAKERAEEIQAELHFPPDQYKDLDDWVLDDETAIGVIKEWLYG